MSAFFTKENKSQIPNLESIRKLDESARKLEREFMELVGDLNRAAKVIPGLRDACDDMSRSLELKAGPLRHE